MWRSELLTTESPPSAGERLARYRAKRDHWRDEAWWLLTHPEDDGVIIDANKLVTAGKWIPSFLRKQAE